VGRRVHVDGEQVTPLAERAATSDKLLRTSDRSS
jgi:hypothetical protein